MFGRLKSQDSSKMNSLCRRFHIMTDSVNLSICVINTRKATAKLTIISNSVPFCKLPLWNLGRAGLEECFWRGFSIRCRVRLIYKSLRILRVEAARGLASQRCLRSVNKPPPHLPIPPIPSYDTANSPRDTRDLSVCNNSGHPQTLRRIRKAKSQILNRISVQPEKGLVYGQINNPYQSPSSATIRHL